MLSNKRRRQSSTDCKQDDSTQSETEETSATIKDAARISRAMKRRAQGDFYNDWLIDDTVVEIDVGGCKFSVSDLTFEREQSCACDATPATCPHGWDKNWAFDTGVIPADGAIFGRILLPWLRTRVLPRINPSIDLEYVRAELAFWGYDDILCGTQEARDKIYETPQQRLVARAKRSKDFKKALLAHPARGTKPIAECFAPKING